jgi:hypothetical protein
MPLSIMIVDLVLLVPMKSLQMAHLLLLVQVDFENCQEPSPDGGPASHEARVNVSTCFALESGWIANWCCIY